MDFRKASVSPPSILDPGSCQAVRIAAILDKPLVCVPVTPERREQNERKQLAYECERKLWNREWEEA
jgi:hypothetical protein